jgi:RNA recognition motif. (a.k.a. RRM, RBD, or RNP domain)
MFHDSMRGFRFPAVNSQKICDVCWANVQGLDANIEHYRNSPILERYRPILFREDGSRKKFPEPDSVVAATIALRETESDRRLGLVATRGPDHNKIFVGGLSKLATHESMRNYFARFGQVRDTSIVIDRTSGKSRGFGFCLFEGPVPWAALSKMTHCIDGAVVAVKRYETPMD